jgi:hypothetical protein
MTFDDQLKALIFYHLEEFSSGSELLQALEQNDFAKECVAPPKGIKKSAFFEAINIGAIGTVKEQIREIRTQVQQYFEAHSPMAFWPSYFTQRAL